MLEPLSRCEGNILFMVIWRRHRDASPLTEDLVTSSSFHRELCTSCGVVVVVVVVFVVLFLFF